MSVDKTESKAFEDFEGESLEETGFIGEELDITHGDNEQVLALAAFQNQGKAYADSDLYPVGHEYPIHHIPGVMKITYFKEDWGGNFICRVYDHIKEAWEKDEWQRNQRIYEHQKDLKDENGNPCGMFPYYTVPMWIVFDLALNHSVHPKLDELEYEQTLWDCYPRLWHAEEHAPKRIIT